MGSCGTRQDKKAEGRQRKAAKSHHHRQRAEKAKAGKIWTICWKGESCLVNLGMTCSFPVAPKRNVTHQNVKICLSLSLLVLSLCLKTEFKVVQVADTSTSWECMTIYEKVGSLLNFLKVQWQFWASLTTRLGLETKRDNASSIEMFLTYTWSALTSILPGTWPRHALKGPVDLWIWMIWSSSQIVVWWALSANPSICEWKEQSNWDSPRQTTSG